MKWIGVSFGKVYRQGFKKERFYAELEDDF